MPKNPTKEQRIAWHREHARHCACRPIPEKLLKAVRQSGRRVEPATPREHDRQALALWAADRARQVLCYFEKERPGDERPRAAIRAARAWARGKMPFREVRAAALAAHAAARATRVPAAIAAARAAGHAAATAHVATHAHGAARYAQKAAEAAGASGEKGWHGRRASPTAPAPLDFGDAKAWRMWLAQNGRKSDGEWVYMYKKGADRPGLRYQEALDEALCFGWIDGQIKAVDKDRFKQRWTPRRKGSVWSQVNKSKVKRLAAEGRMAEAGLAAVRDAKRAGTWQAAYTNQREERVPAELVRALRSEPEAWQNFQRFAPTYRNMYAGWVAQAKQEATRQRRIAAVVRRSMQNRKPGMDSPYS